MYLEINFCFRLKGKIQKEKLHENEQEILFHYVESLIKKLEKKNAAESISKITSFQKFNEIFKFEVNLEDSAFRPRFMDSKVVEELDKFRENSLFSIYPIAQKSPYSLISQNV